MGRFKRSMDIAKSSWRVLKADRELLALPVFSFLASLVVFGVVGGLVFLLDYDASVPLEDFELSTPSYVLLIVGGIATAIVATFFQAAMVGGARERLMGGDPTVSSALAVAVSRLGVIVPWAIFSWTVGAVLRAIEERFGFIGKFVATFAGAAFRVVTFLAVPVLVVEELSPINTLKRSGTLFRQTWGENLIAQVGLSIIGFLAFLPILLIAAAIGAAINVVVAILVAVPLVALVMVVMTSLTAIYQTALYTYVTTNEVPHGFEDAGLKNAFRAR